MYFGARVDNRWVLLRLFLSVVSLSFLMAMLLIATMGYVPDIDRHLDDVEWQTASHFLLDKITVPESLAILPEATEVRVSATQEGLCIGVVDEQSRASYRHAPRCHDTERHVAEIISFNHSQNIAYGFQFGNGGSMRASIW